MESSEITSRARTPSMPKVVSIISLTKNNVINAVGEDLGKIEDVLVDLKAGKIIYVVVSAGGSLLREGQFYAIPWEAMEVSLHDKKLILNVSKETMANAPSFGKNEWPDQSDLSWMNDIYSYYGHEPYWKTAKATKEAGTRG
ncbi:MAG: PRC-barrel domain-containing protein [Dehalococcoidales bacterium]|nr:PRC-barrel domain-containing protein [Dehalococcoidales bacterium]